MQTIPPEVKQLLVSLADEVAELRHAMNRPTMMPNMKQQVMNLLTSPMPQVIPYHMLTAAPVELENIPSGSRLNGSRLEWIIACHYARVRVEAAGRNFTHERPTVEDLKDAQRVATMMTFLGA